MYPVNVVALVDDLPPLHNQMSVATAKARIRANRAVADEFRYFETTDRDGISLHLAYVRYGPGQWLNSDDVTYVFEIPTAALTAI